MTELHELSVRKLPFISKDLVKRDEAKNGDWVLGVELVAVALGSTSAILRVNSNLVAFGSERLYSRNERVSRMA